LVVGTRTGVAPPFLGRLLLEGDRPVQSPQVRSSAEAVGDSFERIAIEIEVLEVLELEEDGWHLRELVAEQIERLQVRELRELCGQGRELVLVELERLERGQREHGIGDAREPIATEAERA